MTQDSASGLQSVQPGPSQRVHTIFYCGRSGAERRRSLVKARPKALRSSRWSSLGLLGRFAPSQYRRQPDSTATAAGQSRVHEVGEASTHFDARTYRHEVAMQWTPLAKRFAKIGVDVCGLICHSGKDLHPEAKRLATLPYFKREKKVVDFFERWPADADMPTDQLFGGSVEELEPTGTEYDPDDAAPWSWDLEPDLFSRYLTCHIFSLK